MNALFEVLTIAIGTAVLAALIVAADWDLSVIRWWHALTAAKARRDDQRAWWSSSVSTPESDMWWVGAHAGSSGFEPADALPGVVSCTERTKADEWLAAAAARQFPGLDRAERRRVDNVARSLPATPLRDVLAAQRGDRPVEAEAA